MTELATTLPARIRDRELAAMPSDWGACVAASRELDMRQLGAWQRLRMHLFKYGALPTGYKALAGICGCGPKAFERMAPALALHFDRDEHDGWTDHDLVAARGGRAVVPQRDGIDPALSDARRQAGRAGAARRWNSRPPLELVASADPAVLPSDAMAKPPADDGKTPIDLPPFDHGFCHSIDPSVASASHGSIDRSSLEMRVVRSSDLAPASAVETLANPVANAVANGMANPAASDGKAAAPVMANEAPPPAMPSRSLDEVDDAALIAALRPLVPKVPAALLNTGDLAPLRVLLADGCELERDVLPAVRNFATGLRDPLRTLKAPQIREKAMASRDGARAAVARAATASSGTAGARTFVDEGSPPWRAWLKSKGVRSHAVSQPDADRTRRGWWFPTQWPPGWDAARLAAVEAPQTG